MAEVNVGTAVSTEEVVADEKVVDMDPKMRLLDPDQTQFTTMTSRMGSRVATREKVGRSGLIYFLGRDDIDEVLIDTETGVEVVGAAQG